MENQFEELHRSQSPVSILASKIENLSSEDDDQPKVVQRCLFPTSSATLRRTQSFDSNKVRKLEDQNHPTSRRKQRILSFPCSIDDEPTDSTNRIINEETQLPEIIAPSFFPPSGTFCDGVDSLFKPFPSASMKKQNLFSSRAINVVGNSYLSKSDSQLLDMSSQPMEPLGSPPHTSSFEFSGNNSDSSSIPEETSLLLPIVESKQSIPYVSADTVSKLLSGDKDYLHINYTIVDCRYEFEFNGGHIKGAHNIKTPQELENRYLKSPTYKPKDVFIFHCEFSSYRGPNLCLLLRNRDRQYHQDSYPLLYYPQLYVLKDGFKNFYENYPHLCDPSAYIPMLDPRFKEELKQYKQFLRNDSASKVKRSLSTGDIKFHSRKSTNH